MSEELLDAVEAGDIGEVRRLLDGGADVHVRGANRDTKHGTELTRPFVTPLHQAAERGNAEIVELLLDRGTDVDVQDGFGNTALVYAAWDNDTTMAKLLLGC